MLRWLEILLTLVLFTVVMSVASLFVGAGVPVFHTWAISHIGHIGYDIGLVVVLGSGGLYSWLGHRKAGRNPKGRGA